jgi:hypothetical protein
MIKGLLRLRLKASILISNILITVKILIAFVGKIQERSEELNGRK